MAKAYEATCRPEWSNNPDVSDNGFNTYLDFPSINPDDSVFGTICVMDFEVHPFNDTYLNLLKTINDSHGHLVGDKAIVTFANALSDVFRESDLIARVGGDEFFVIAFLDKSEELKLVIHRVESYLENNPVDGAGTIRFSYGSSQYNTKELKTLQMETLIEEADRKLYTCKSSRTITAPPP